MTGVADGFAPKMKAFATQWAALWSLDSEARANVVQKVIELRRAKGSRQYERQREIVDAVAAEPTGSAGSAALGLLDYLAHLWVHSDETEEEMVAECDRLGFFEGAGGGGPEFVAGFFTHLREAGFARGHSPAAAFHEILRDVSLQAIRRIDLGLEGDWSGSVVPIWTAEEGFLGLDGAIRSHPDRRPALELYFDGAWIGLHCCTVQDGVHQLDEAFVTGMVEFVERTLAYPSS